MHCCLHNYPPPHLQVEQLRRVGLRHLAEFVVGIQRLADALQGGEGAEHEGEGGGEPGGRCGMCISVGVCVSRCCAGGSSVLPVPSRVDTVGSTKVEVAGNLAGGLAWVVCCAKVHDAQAGRWSWTAAVQCTCSPLVCI